ncbi:MAG: nucleoside phosphorylase [Eubacteriales bacterium]|nr:nucleoside phosphorylase [Eubacteriales bacterium]
MLLTEFDPSKNAVINPWNIHQNQADFPETVVAVFSRHLFQSVLALLNGREIASVQDANGENPVYEVDYRGKRFGFHMALVGAPSCVGDFEDLIALGARRIILLGNCGVLDREIQDCGIIIPTRAIRDEGTSYHYAPAADFMEVNRKYREDFQAVLTACGYPWVEGITWTTDAFYRETRARVARRRQMGAICVEMECAAMAAMCNFRGVELFQFFYAGDNLDHAAWDPRSLSGGVRLDDKQKIALLAFELAWRIGP